MSSQDVSECFGIIWIGLMGCQVGFLMYVLWLPGWFSHVCSNGPGKLTIYVIDMTLLSLGA
jgi:hypothetical protein